MAVMAVVVLVLFVLLVQQKTDESKFAEELEQLLVETSEMVQYQQEVLDIVRELFSTDECQVSYDGGRLELADRKAGLYGEAQVALTVEARRALKSCAEQFTTLVLCLSPRSDGVETECLRRVAANSYRDPEQLQQILATMRKGIDSLVLEGNTDKQMYRGSGVAAIQGLRTGLRRDDRSFVTNAYLGAERARQALGHLVAILHEQEEVPAGVDLVDILKSRVSIESPAYGKYQAGDRWKECDAAAEACPAARNLQLEIRWKEEELRQPYLSVQKKLCGYLQDPASSFSKALGDEKRDGLLNSACRGPQS